MTSLCNDSRRTESQYASGKTAKNTVVDMMATRAKRPQGRQKLMTVTTGIFRTLSADRKTWGFS